MKKALTLLAALLAAVGLPASPVDASPLTSVSSDGSYVVEFDETVVTPGSSFRIDVTYHNDTGSTLTDLEMWLRFEHDTYAVTDTCTSEHPNIECSQSSETPMWFKLDIDPVADDETVTGHISGTIKNTLAPGTQFTVEPEVVYGSGGTPVTDSSPPVVTYTVVSDDTDVRLGLVATGPPLLSSYIDYTLTVTNDSEEPFAQGEVQLALPTQATGLTNPPAGCSYSSGTDIVTCSVGALLEEDDFTTRSLRVTYGALSLGLPLNATAALTASEPVDDNPTNDFATDGCTVVTGLIILC